MKKLLLLLVLGASIISCNKNQRAVKKLDGKWKATKFVVTSGVFTADIIAFGAQVEMSFEACKLKNDEWCNSTITVTFNNDTVSDSPLYKVTNDGNTLEIGEVTLEVENVNLEGLKKIDIIALSKNSATLEFTQGDSKNEIKLEKI